MCQSQSGKREGLEQSVREGVWEMRVGSRGQGPERGLPGPLCGEGLEGSDGHWQCPGKRGLGLKRSGHARTKSWGGIHKAWAWGGGCLVWQVQVE